MLSTRSSPQCGSCASFGNADIRQTRARVERDLLQRRHSLRISGVRSGDPVVAREVLRQGWFGDVGHEPKVGGDSLPCRGQEAPQCALGESRACADTCQQSVRQETRPRQQGGMEVGEEIDRLELPPTGGYTLTGACRGRRLRSRRCARWTRASGRGGRHCLGTPALKCAGRCSPAWPATNRPSLARSWYGSTSTSGTI